MSKPYYQDNLRTVYNKSCTDMSELENESVQMCVTSPPYWGLRKYAGNQDLIWGGTNHHEHEWVTERTKRANGAGGISNKTMLERKGVDNFQQFTDYQDRATYANACSICGAWRGAYGLEPTPELYISHTIEILREIRRVLRKDGVVFWNVGDSYGGSGKGGAKTERSAKQMTNAGSINPKDLCLIPFRVAIAAQEAGWWVRSVIIWNKPNPMPESVKDRPTESHEYILMLVKGQSSIRTIKFSELTNKATELPDNRFFKNPGVRNITRLCVVIATSILNSPYIQKDLCLFLLNPQIWQKSLEAIRSGLIGELPAKQVMLSYASSFLYGDITAEDFLKKLNSAIVNLGNNNIFLIAGGVPFIGNSPSIYSDGKGTITIHDSGEICKFDFIHDIIIAQRNTTCKYYWDMEAVLEPIADSTIGRGPVAFGGDKGRNYNPDQTDPNFRNGSEQWGRVYDYQKSSRKMQDADKNIGGNGSGFKGHSGNYDANGNLLGNPLGRNIRSVWTFPTMPYREAHFATFPEELPTRCIKAGSKEGDLVLDPFCGSGTTLFVASKLGRKSVGYELSAEYCDLIIERNKQQVMELTQ